MGGAKPQTRLSKTKEFGASVIAAKLFNAASNLETASAEAQRKVLADFCRFFGQQLSGQLETFNASNPSGESKPEPNTYRLAPRVQQTLERLLAGDSEKEIGIRLKVSKHTVHVYVKALYRHFEVNSRGELLARFVDGAYRTRPGN